VGFPFAGFGVGVVAVPRKELPLDFDPFPVVASMGFGVGATPWRSEEFDFELLTELASTGCGVGDGATRERSD
jgi:hypothetical protein